MLSEEWVAALWTIAVGAITNSCCALLGCYLVLRRMSLLGDAISHAVLPGIAMAFLLMGSISTGPMVGAAMVMGLLTALATRALSDVGGVAEDASLGVVLTSFFALGVLMISRYARSSHLDDCVLYGLLDLAPINAVAIGGVWVPRAMLTLLPALAATLLFVLLLWKELRLVAFDPGFASATGISASLIHYALMAMTALVVVSSFEAVGSILVVAMLIVPAAAARLLTERVGAMLAVAVAIGVVSALLGYLGASAWNVNVAGMMACATGLIFFVTVLFAPKQGVLGRMIHRFRLALRIVAEDALAMAYRWEERRGASTSGPPIEKCLAAMGGGLRARWALWSLERAGEVAVTHVGQLHLTEAGRTRARSLVRSHRLWEAYLDQHFAIPRDHLHEAAERLEHYIGPDLQRALAHELGPTMEDPHGRPIPEEGLKED